MAEIMTVLSVLAIPWVTTAARARTPLSSELPNERFTFGGSEIEANAASSDAADVSPWRRVSSNLRCRDERRATRASLKAEATWLGGGKWDRRRRRRGRTKPGKSGELFFVFYQKRRPFFKLARPGERERERERESGGERGRERGRERARRRRRRW